MMKKTLFAAAFILAATVLTACSASDSKQPAEPEPQPETVVAQSLDETSAEKVITDKNIIPKQTEASQETEPAEKAPQEETTKAPEPETTTAAVEDPVKDTDPAEDTEPAEEPFQGVVSADGFGLTLREGPDSTYGDLTIIPDGTELSVEEIQDGWGRVDYEGYSGWVSLDYIEKE